MSSSMMMLGVTLKLFDQMSGGMRNIAGSVDGLRNKIKGLSEQAGALGRASMANGLIAGGALMKSVSAFSTLEDASTRLKVTMMDKNGLTGAFKEVNALAVKLGNELPGTSADFLSMMATLKQFGITDQSILGGVGEATAKIAVLMKQTPEQAAEFAAKLKAATGTADKDMLAFMDTIQRIYHQGVDATQMMYAFARSAGALKQVKVQGLEASREISALYAILIKTGASGETVGTGMGTILNTLTDTKKIGDVNKLLSQKGYQTLQFTDKKGSFLGVENMVAQFEKLKGLSEGEQGVILRKLFGGGQDMQMVATLISNGMDGYKKMQADMEKQAALQKRVNEQLGTLGAMWDAASGTFINTIADFAGAIAPELKMLTAWFGALSKKVGDFIKENPTLAKWIGLAVLGFTALMLVSGSVLLTFAAIASGVAFVWPLFVKLVTLIMWTGRIIGGFAWLGKLLAVALFKDLIPALRMVGAVLMFVGRALLMNPIGLFITAIALAALAIYKYWEPIKGFFKGLWDGVVSAFNSAWQTIASGFAKLKSMLPDWMVKLVGGKPNSLGGPAPSMGPAVPSPPRRGQGAEVGGEIRVRVDQDGRVASVRATTSNPRVPMNVDSGRMMVAP